MLQLLEPWVQGLCAPCEACHFIGGCVLPDFAYIRNPTLQTPPLGRNALLRYTFGPGLTPPPPLRTVIVMLSSTFGYYLTFHLHNHTFYWLGLALLVLLVPPAPTAPKRQIIRRLGRPNVFLRRLRRPNVICSAPTPPTFCLFGAYAAKTCLGSPR